MPVRPIPTLPSVEFDRKAARRLLEAARAGDAVALQRIAESHPRWRDGERIDVSCLQLADTQLVVAREYGFASWPRWRRFCEDRRRGGAERAAAMVTALCSAEFRHGTELLAAEPELATADVYAACACGEAEAVRAHLARDPVAATRPGGPLGWAPILYACFSRFLRRDPERAAGIVETVRLLLAAGADANSFYLVEHGEGALPQTCLYAAAGIANHAELTGLLLAAGADAAERVSVEHEAPNEALYHAAEFPNTACLALLLERHEVPDPVTYCLGRALDFLNDEAALLFLEHGADAGHAIAPHGARTHLHKAVTKRHSERVIRALLEGGADPNRADDEGMTPYRIAVGAYPEVVPLLEAFGADPAQAAAEDLARGALQAASPEQLLLAARRGDLGRIESLLDAGTPVDSPDDFPALHGACYAGQLEAGRLLLDRGARLTTTNHFGGDPVGVVIYGSTDCAHPEGGPGMILPEEFCGDWPALLQLLLERGAPLPQRVQGSDAVQEVLRRHGVPEAEGD